MDRNHRRSYTDNNAISNSFKGEKLAIAERTINDAGVFLNWFQRTELNLFEIPIPMMLFKQATPELITNGMKANAAHIYADLDIRTRVQNLTSKLEQFTKDYLPIKAALH